MDNVLGARRFQSAVAGNTSLRSGVGRTPGNVDLVGCVIGGNTLTGGGDGIKSTTTTVDSLTSNPDLFAVPVVASDFIGAVELFQAGSPLMEDDGAGGLRIQRALVVCDSRSMLHQAVLAGEFISLVITKVKVGTDTGVDFFAHPVKGWSLQ